MEKLISKRVMTSLQVVHSIFRRTQPFTKYELTAKFFVKRLYSKNYFQLSHSFLSMKHANIALYGGHYVDPELVPRPTYQRWDYGPDCLCLLQKIAACYFLLVIYSLLFLYDSLLCRK